MSLARRLSTCVLISVLAWSAASAALVGVTGDGATVPESLYFLSTADASSTFIMNLGNGNDGEAIGSNPTDGLVYHASGITTGTRFWESIDVDAPTIVTSGQLTGPAVADEQLAIVYNPATGRFLVSSRDNGVFFDVTTAGVATDIGSTPADLKGLAFVGSTLYGADAFDGVLYELNPLNGAVLATHAVTLGGAALSGFNGLATDPGGDVAFSTASNQYVTGSNGPVYVRQMNAYRWNRSTGAVTLVFDGEALGLTTLDAAALARGIVPEID